jgi:hypothetical protein
MLRAIGLGVLTLVLTACGGGPIIMSGRVVDHRGMPVTKAEVVTEPQTDLVVTNNRGFFVLRQRINDIGETEPIPLGVYRIHVRKFGFQDLAFEVKAEGGPLKVADLILQPRTPDIGEAAPDVLEDQERAPDEGSVPKNGI